MLLDKPDIEQCNKAIHMVESKVAKVMEGNTERKTVQLDALKMSIDSD